MPFSHIDKENNRVYTYEYDSLGRIVRQFGGTLSTGANRFASQYRYDKSNNITKLTTVADGFRSAVAYTYNNENIPTKTTFDSGATQEYVYDGLNRLNSYELATDTPYTVSYNYHASDRGSYTNGNVSGTYRTTQLRQELLGNRGYVYTYDDVGNITAITEKASGSTSFNAKVSYEYDALGQLTYLDTCLKILAFLLFGYTLANVLKALILKFFYNIEGEKKQQMYRELETIRAERHKENEAVNQ